MIKYLLIALGCLSFQISCQKKGAHDSDPIRIGLILSLTGPEAPFGLAAKAGVDFAIREINHQGGLHGHTLAIVAVDYKGEIESIAALTQSLASDSHIVAIVGESMTAPSLRAATVAQREKVPYVSPASTNSQLTQTGSYIFRTCFTDDFQGRVMAIYARSKLNIQKISILEEKGSPYSQELSQAFQQEWLKQKGTIITQDSYQKGTTDFKNVLTKVKKLESEGIYIPGYYYDIANIALQARQLGVTLPLLGSDGWEGKELLEVMGTSIEPAFMTNHFVSKDFESKYQREFNSPATTVAALAYDTVQMIAAAIKRVDPNKLSRDSLRTALAETTRFKGVTGTITIDKDRNVHKPAVVLRITPTAFELLSIVPPQ